MKIQFDDKSYVDIHKMDNGKIAITIVARDENSLQKKVVNSVQLDPDQFKQLISDVQV